MDPDPDLFVGVRSSHKSFGSGHKSFGSGHKSFGPATLQLRRSTEAHNPRNGIRSNPSELGNRRRHRLYITAVHTIIFYLKKYIYPRYNNVYARIRNQDHVDPDPGNKKNSKNWKRQISFTGQFRPLKMLVKNIYI